MTQFVTRDACPACRSPRTVTRFEAPFASDVVGELIRNFYQRDPAVLGDAVYQLDECEDCGAVFQRMVGDDAFLGELYTDWVRHTDQPDTQIATYRRAIRNVRQSRDAHELMTIAAYLGRPLSALKTLDYGMGWALWARTAEQLGCQSFGSDLSQPRMEFAAGHGVRTIADAEISEHRFDFINTEQVMEHVPDPAGLTELLAGALAPGGVLKISVPAGDDADALIAEVRAARKAEDWQNYMPIHPLEHINTFRRSSLRAMTARCGLREVRPSLAQRYAFLRHAGAISPRAPRLALKELARPVYQYSNRRNLYAWFRRD